MRCRVRPPAFVRTLATAGLLLTLGCDPQKAVVGTWELASIDGVGHSVAPPLRVMFPAVVYGTDTLALHGLWHEVTLDSLVLTLDADGAYATRSVEAKRVLARENTFERPDYVSGAFGGDLIRADARAEPTESSGSWTLAGDTLALTQPRDRVVAELTARVHQALPDVPTEAVQAALETAVPGTPPPRWIGTLKGDRLELLDAERRRFTFRKAGSGR